MALAALCVCEFASLVPPRKFHVIAHSRCRNYSWLSYRVIETPSKKILFQREINFSFGFAAMASLAFLAFLERSL